MDSPFDLSEADFEIIDYPAEVPGKPARKICVPRYPDILNQILRSPRPWEHAILHAFFSRSGPDAAYVEVGANVGSDTLRASDYFKACYAFEPVRKHIAMFKKNMEMNGVTHVQLIPAAVSDRPRSASMYLGPINIDGAATLLADQPGRGQSETVNVVTLDSALPSDLTNVRFIHIDAQGHDIKVLQGARQFIARQTDRPVIKMEFQPRTLQLNGSSVRDLLDFMRSFSYSAGFDAQCHLVPLTPTMLGEMFMHWQMDDGWIDIFLLPQNNPA